MLDAIQHKHTVLATNAHEDTLTIKFSRVPLAPYFDHVVTSHQLGAAKEDRDFWQALQQRVNFDPDRTLLIDDNRSVLEAAREFGIKCLLTVAQPDLHQPPQAANEYPAITHFNQLIDPVS
jgi:putative hydrolase of the HAD superfamily